MELHSVYECSSVEAALLVRFDVIRRSIKCYRMVYVAAIALRRNNGGKQASGERYGMYRASTPCLLSCSDMSVVKSR